MPVSHWTVKLLNSLVEVILLMPDWWLQGMTYAFRWVLIQ